MRSPNGTPFKYKAFISYNHRDLKFAKTLHQKLESFTFKAASDTAGNKKPLFPIFLDENELKAGETLSEAIQDAIRSSEFLIVICSKNSVESKWVAAEVAFMKGLNRSQHIIGVIPEKNGNEAHLADIFGQNSETLAADFRPGKNKNLQLSKIAAKILEVDLDEVYQRESRRKNKQLLSLGAGLSAVAVLMSSLAANAYFSEVEAVRQKQNSEEIISFMIDEFRDDLEKLDKLDLLANVSEKAQEYFEDRDLNSLSDESVILQSRTLRQLADVDEKRGEIGSAKLRIISALTASKHILERLPTNKDAIREHADNADYLGYIEYQLGQLETAKGLFQSAKTSYDTGAKLFPDDPYLVWKSAVAENNIGIMILQLGQTEEARPYLERTLKAVEKQYLSKSLNEDELYEYASMYTWYIRSLPDTTPLSTFYEARQKQLNLFQDMHGNGARTIRNQAETLNVQRAVVILLLNWGKDSEAEALMLEIQAGFEALLEHDPANVGWRWHLIRSKLTASNLHHTHGRKNKRNELLEEALRLTEKPDGETWGLTTDIDRRINRLTAYRLFEEVSLDAAIERLAIAEKKILDHRKGVLNPRIKYTLASLKNCEAEILNQAGRTEDAKKAQQSVLELLSGKESFSIPEQIILHSAYVDLNMTEAETALRTKLETRGVALDN